MKMNLLKKLKNLMKIIKYLFEALFIYTFFIIIKLIGLNNGRKVATFIFKKY